MKNQPLSNMQHKRWQDMLKDMKHVYIERTAPGFYAASGGKTMKLKSYRDDTANGLTAAIIDFLKFSGHYAHRINSMGTARTEKIPLAFGNVREVVRWTPGTTNKGTADIMAIIHGKPVSIEIKIGADRQSDNQKKEEQRIKAAGGEYRICQDFTSFLTWYNETFAGVQVAPSLENNL